MHQSGKRLREGTGGEGGGGGMKRSDGSDQEKVAVEASDAPCMELPGATLGSGTRWSLTKPVEKDQTERKRVEHKFAKMGADKDAANLSTEVIRLRKRCEAMLEQALSRSEHGDVLFRLGDGRSPLSGHRAVLCAASEQYAGMFRSGMVEGQEGIIGVPPRISELGYRGLLEWLYLGRAGGECARADGRELWILSEMYEVEGMREWLLEKGIDGSNFGSAYEFGLVAEGVDREGIVSRCLAVLEDGDGKMEMSGMRGVGKEAALKLARARAKQGEGSRRFGWKCVRDSVRVLEGWMKTNVGGDVSWFQQAVHQLDFTMMPLKVFRDAVEGCEYVDGRWAASLVESKKAAGGNAYDVEYKVERVYNLEGDVDRIGHIALDGEGPSQRMAVVDSNENRLHGRVLIFNVRSGQLVAICASTMNNPCGVAFSRAGELYVSEYASGQIHVFDRQGRCVRVFGTQGLKFGEEQFRSTPAGICFTANDDLLVVDRCNHRVKILQQDGTIRLLGLGLKGAGDGEFCHPGDVSVGPDGSIAVADSGNHRVQIFDADGKFLRSIGSKGKGPGQFEAPYSLAVGRGREVIVGDFNPYTPDLEGEDYGGDTKIFSAEGELLQTLKADRSSGILQTYERVGICVDGEDRLFVCDGRRVVVLS